MNTRLLFGLLWLTPTLCFGALSTTTSYFLNVEALTNVTARSAVRGLTGVFTNGLTAGPSQIDFNTTVLTYGATTDLDLSGPNYQTLALTGDVIFTTSNRSTGRWKTVLITSDGSARTFTFPAGWDFASGSAPASIAANKVGILTVFFRDNTDANAVATYSVQDAAVGDVVGPASSTNTALARYDGTTGKLLKNSSWNLSDAGTMTLGGTGDVTPATDNVSDLGETSFRFANIRFANTAQGGNFSALNSGAYSWSTRSILRSPVNGQMILSVNAETGAATQFQLGVDASTVASHEVKAGDGVGTDIPGGTLLVEGGQSTGTAKSGAVILQTANSSGASGSSANTYSERFHAPAKWVTLTSATATTLFTIPVPATNYVGLTATVTIYATDGTDHQSKTSVITVDAIAKTTTITPTISQVDNTTAASAGTLTCAYTAVDNTSNVLAIKANADSSLSETVLRAKIVITAINSNGTASVTEL